MAAVLAAASLSLAAGCSSGGGSGVQSADSGGPASTAASAPSDRSAAPAPHDYTVDTAASVPGSAHWTQAHQRGQLVVSIPHSGTPGVASKVNGGDRYSGFDIEIATMIAADIGFGPDRIRVVPGPTMDSAGGRLRWPNDVDFSVGLTWIDTGDGTQPPFLLSDPYYAGGAALLVARNNDAITTTTDPLAGRRLCLVEGDDNQEDAKTAYPQAVQVPLPQLANCEASLLGGQVDAVYGPDLDLRGLAAERPDDVRPVGPPVSPPGLAVAVPTGETALRDAINASLRHHIDNGDWQAAYQATLGPSGATASPPPATREPRTGS
ncbi:transporter substrate-binding domain-containing protein [Yinghuangia sp. ASG 101]|uniref:transporter substrate-binding domain-containing protein n=1 Tax=Yinghuangia sp. ASG 101 TaxID=2896848 RepID=UPI001E422619|nr:transporter substrate-binding domain-containing protein [Yinghuangia sp. ASG 101]UGQ11477.1 transporter substrate-binding domain-containing protein [Yinghuangia sp. ASG 101]